MKTLGFFGVVLIVMVALRPSLFLNLFSSSETTSNSEQTTSDDNTTRQIEPTTSKPETYVDPRRPSLVSKTGDKPSKMNADGEPEFTQYAEGYSKKDFGTAYEPEQFPNSEDGSMQAEGIWETLLTLKFDIKYDYSIDDMVFKPLFTPAIRAYAGKEIEVMGFIVPHDIVKTGTGSTNQGDMFMFSAYPAATCFFCGAAGPESILEVYPKKPISYSKNKIKIKGRLELNDVDFLRMAYILKDARLVE